MNTTKIRSYGKFVFKPTGKDEHGHIIGTQTTYRKIDGKYTLESIIELSRIDFNYLTDSKDLFQGAY